MHAAQLRIDADRRAACGYTENEIRLPAHGGGHLLSDCVNHLLRGRKAFDLHCVSDVGGITTSTTCCRERERDRALRRLDLQPPYVAARRDFGEP